MVKDVLQRISQNEGISHSWEELEEMLNTVPQEFFRVTLGVFDVKEDGRRLLASAEIRTEETKQALVHKVRETVPENTRRNRRFKAMEQRSHDDDFFGLAAIKKRDPTAYHEYVGKHETTIETREQKSLTEKISSGEGLPEELKYLHRMVEKTRELIDAEDHMEEDEEEQEDTRENHPPPVPSSAEDRDDYHSQLISFMKDRFINGLDPSIDFPSIDIDETLDDSKLMGQQEDDAYFNDAPAYIIPCHGVANRYHASMQRLQASHAPDTMVRNEANNWGF
eukprot:TRINITY_DN19698_c0_g1_i3.p1 TRINITY_DN19698_c0_g1~~TRINITY_DN19698_c0_g1_i3.p1  ORF type:complete len:305 (+),score=76.26 TRINITY_DN19698_c0_g1_i3:78-917(+)